MTIEICGDSTEAYKLAKQFGAKRIELCSGLSVGGLTPSYGLIAQCFKIGGVEIHVMIRNSEGNFVYTNSDIEAMKTDITQSKNAGASGVVFGCLTSLNEIDTEQNKQLFKHAKSLGLEVTFHRAFDFCKDPNIALKQLVEIGFDRLLTSGQQAKAIEGKLTIKNLVNQSQGRIEIMAGSGVNESNVKELSALGIDALHFTSHTSKENLNLGMGRELIPDELKVGNIMAVLNQ